MIVIRRWLSVFWLGLVAVSPAIAATSLADKPNVLMIVVDDLNDWIGCLGGHPQVKTPNIDRLAARGTLFLSAHAQAPLCNPSRSSVMTGLRPSTTGIYGLMPGIRDVARTKQQVTLPQTFTEAGYWTYTCGKVYHDGSIAPADRAREFTVWGPALPMGRPPKPFSNLPEPRNKLMDWGMFPERDEDGTDYKTASSAATALFDAKPDRPFFIAAGFRLPHVPCYAPPRWFELYPTATLAMPPVLEGDRDDTPRFSWYLHWRLPEPRLKVLQERNEWKPLVRAYLASISYMDAQVGRVLDALDQTGRGDQTIVVLWSDHGYHLGEKAISGKNTLWERSTHVPLIMAGPGIGRGTKTERPVELLDLFPTLLELASFPDRSDLEGHSLVPLLKDPQAPWIWPAITTHNQGNHSVRTQQWRYIHYADGTEELYDRRTDLEEYRNLANEPRCSAILAEHRRWLPKIDVPIAPGSAERVLSYDPALDEAVWEGEVVRRNDPIP